MHNNSGLASPNIKAIIFDIDGTLYSNSIMCAAHPFLYLRNILWIFRFSKMRKALRAQLGTMVHPNEIENCSQSFWKMNVDLFSRVINASPKVAERLLQRHVYDLWISALANTPIRPGMRHLLGELYRSGIKLGILSDFKPNEKIANWNLSAYFEAIVCAEDYGLLKPDKRIFLHTSELLACKPEETVFVGNHLKYDGLGASNAGMHSVLFYRRSSTAKQAERIHGLHIIKNITELRAVLQSMNVSLKE